MAESFDPYHQWLGIPPAEQPPNHYRLLGLAAFENDPNVIANAADRQMAHLRSFGTSKHSALSQRLLNEVAAAKVALLKPEKKTAYDTNLRARIGGRPPITDTNAGPPPRAAPPVATAPAFSSAPRTNAPVQGTVSSSAAAEAPQFSAARSRSVTAELKRQRNGSQLYAIAAGVLVLAGGGGFLAWQLNNKPDTVTQSDTAPPETLKGAPSQATNGHSNRAHSNGTDSTAVNAANSENKNVQATENNPQSQTPTQVVNNDSQHRVPAVTTDQADPPKPAVKLPAPDDQPFERMPKFPGLAARIDERLPPGDPRAQALRPGLVVLRYPRHESQINTPGGFVLPRNLGSRISRAVTPRAARFQYNVELNVLLVGYVLINESGEYRITSPNPLGRDAIYLSGKPVVYYTGQPREPEKITLEEGYHPIVIAGFAGGDGVTGAQIGFERSGRTVQLGNAVFLHEPAAQAIARNTPTQPPRPNEQPQTAPAKTLAKTPLPSDEQQEATEKQVRELFQKDFAGVKKAADKTRLAVTLLQHADDSRDDPVAMFVLLDLARTSAIEAGDAPLALRAQDRIKAKYDIDGSAEQLATLTKLAGMPLQSAALRATYEGAWTLAVELVSEDKFDEAAKALKIAQGVATKAKENEFARQTAQRIKDLAALEREYESVKDSLATLASSPNDPQANLAAGRWHWFAKGRFDQGIKHLAKSSDEQLKSAAEKDLAGPNSSKDQVELANLWMEASEKRKAAEKMALEGRAFYWYLKASLAATGLEKAVIEKRIEELRGGVEKRLLADVSKPAVGDASEEAGFLMPGLVVEYFADPQMQRRLGIRPVNTLRTDPAHQRELGVTTAAVRWTGWLVPEKSGLYNIRVDTRASLWIDGRPVMSPQIASKAATARTKSAAPGSQYDVVLELTARPHHIRYDMPNAPFGFSPAFFFYPAGDAQQFVRADSLYHVPLAGEAPVELRRTRVNPALQN
jgi:hypothetical protein